MIQMKEIRPRIANYRAQIFLCREKVLLSFLHPVEAKRSGMIFQAMQAIHPSSLVGKRDLSEADERDLRSMSHEPGNELARISPHSAERVSRYQYAHRTPGIEGQNRPRRACDQCRTSRQAEGRTILGKSAVS